MAPVSTFAQQPTPTPKYKGKGGGGGPPQGTQGGKPQFNQQQQQHQQQIVHKPVVTTTPAPAHTSFTKPATQKAVIHNNAVVPTPAPKFTGGTGKPQYHKGGNGTPPPTVNNNIVNGNNHTSNQGPGGKPQFSKGNGGKPSGPVVVNNTNFVHNTPATVHNNSWSGPRGGGGKFNRANNYGGHWVEANVHSDWDRRGIHEWDGHRFRWFNGGWLIIDNGFWPTGYYAYQPGGSKIFNAQAELADMGYYNGAVDGVVGPMTRQAIADYQADNGLPVDGYLNPPTQDSLGL